MTLSSLSTQDLLFEFIIKELRVDNLEDARCVDVSYIEASEIFESDWDLEDLWDILHFTTQSELASRVKAHLLDLFTNPSDS